MTSPVVPGKLLTTHVSRAMADAESLDGLLKNLCSIILVGWLFEPGAERDAKTPKIRGSENGLRRAPWNSRRRADRPLMCGTANVTGSLLISDGEPTYATACSCQSTSSRHQVSDHEKSLSRTLKDMKLFMTELSYMLTPLPKTERPSSMQNHAGWSRRRLLGFAEAEVVAICGR